MELTSIGMEVARRELELDGNKIVTVVIGKPELFPDNVNYYCPFKIEGIGNEKVRYAGGADSMQALYLCLRMIGTVLDASEPGKAGRLTLYGERDLGFPLYEDQLGRDSK